MLVVLSIYVFFIHFLTELIQGLEMNKGEEMKLKITLRLFGVATLLTMIGMGTMIITFIMGTYTVLEPSLGLAITVCLIGLSFF